MAVDTPAKIAVLGAGPIGLEAALYARFLGYDVVLFERGQVCQQVLPWGHLRMVTPLAMNRSLLGLAAIQAQDESFQLPPDDALLTGAEWVEQYLLPLSQTDLLADHLRLDTEVLAVGKEALRKHELPGHEDRGDWSFRILVRQSDGAEKVELADVVIDATGVLGQPNWIGHGGIPAIGEIALRAQIDRRFPDFLGADRMRHAGRHTLLIGDDWFAAHNALGLAALAREVPDTRVTWITHREPPPGRHEPVTSPGDDPLAGRARIVAEANSWAASSGESIQYWPGTFVESIQKSSDSNAFAIELSGGHSGVFEFDQVVASVGFKPDRAICSELQIQSCYATDRTTGTEPVAGDGASHLQPEPNYYMLGAKSFGRDPGFLFSEGLNQIRQLFTVIGDRETLDLYSSAKNLLR